MEQKMPRPPPTEPLPGPPRLSAAPPGPPWLRLGLGLRPPPPPPGPGLWVVEETDAAPDVTLRAGRPGLREVEVLYRGGEAGAGAGAVEGHSG